MSPGAPQEGAEAAPLRRSVAFARSVVSHFASGSDANQGDRSANLSLAIAIAFAFEEVTREDDELLTLIARWLFAEPS